MRFLRARFALAAVLVAAMSSCGEFASRQGLQTFTGSTMGTVYTVKVVPEGVDSAVLKAAPDAIQETLDRIDGLMSTYQPDSELSQFNTSTSIDPTPLSPQLTDVFRIAQRVSRETGGAFDVTVGPLVNAWGFGPENAGNEPPSEEKLAELAARVGYEKLELDKANGAIRKSNPGVYCDLSAVAKGYAVDAVCARLDELGFARYMVEVGGEIRTSGTNADGEPWRIAIEKPDPGSRSIHRVIPLEDLALASSGDYRNFFEHDGVRYSHTIDPKTLRPVRHKLAAASVVHETCAEADAYATALMVMGPERALEFANAEGLAALLLVHDDSGGFVEVSSSAFQRFLTSK